MNALLLVDIQYDFLPGGTLAVARGDEVIPVANRLIPAFPLVIASQDWHPADHGSFAVNHPGTRPGQIIDLGGLPQVLWPPHCIQGTRGAELSADLDQGRIRRVFRKGTDREIDSYSAFFDNGHRRSTGLSDYLQAEGAERLYILGLATDYCVRYTVLDALALDFRVALVEDGCRGVELQAGDSLRALRDMASAGAEIMRERAVPPSLPSGVSGSAPPARC